MTLDDLKKLKGTLNQKPIIPENKGRTLEELIQAANAADEKRAKRIPKTQEEKADLEYQKILEAFNNKEVLPIQAEEPKYNIKVHDPKKKWDVLKDEEIEYFDPTLSYELTGYRPITETEGLDFNPKEFTKAADYYRLHKTYTHFIPGTFKHKQHWTDEFNKCLNGVTIGKYRLTGEHYFFLNYYRLLSVLGEGKKESREEDFPGFLAKQYEYFHYLELARLTGHDACIFKCRGVGYSEVIASNLSHAYTFHKASKSIISAAAQNYVDNTLAKTWQELDFLNTCTQGGFKRLRQKIDTAMHKRASKVDKDRNESGWMSEIEGIVTDNPRKLRGSRVYNLYFEESGSFPGLIDTYIQSRALVDILGYRIGMRIVGGTGGDQGPQLAGLNKIFNNPEEYSVLPYKNTYAQDGSVQYTGFFIPSYEMWFGEEGKPGFDSRGVVDKKRAKEHYLKKWEKIKDPVLLAKDKAEYCFTPEDAFILEGSNRFDQELLVDQLHALTIHKTVEMPKSIRLLWGRTKDGEVDRDSRPTLEIIDKSPIQICELPILDDNGLPYTDLYVCGVDSIDSDSTTATGQTDVSDFCMVVYRKQFGLKPPKVVAIYKERPKHIQMAFDNALKLCQFYNAKMLFEATRVSIKNYFQQHNKLYWLMRRPNVTANTTTKTNLKQFGCPVNPNIIDHYLDLIEQFIVDYSEGIQFPQMIDELMRYSYENKRKFDIVAALGMVLIAAEETQGRIARASYKQGSEWKFGYIKNAYGQIETTLGRDGEKQTARTGSEEYNLFPVQSRVHEPIGGSFWRR